MLATIINLIFSRVKSPRFLELVRIRKIWKSVGVIIYWSSVNKPASWLVHTIRKTHVAPQNERRALGARAYIRETRAFWVSNEISSPCTLCRVRLMTRESSGPKPRTSYVRSAQPAASAFWGRALIMEHFLQYSYMRKTHWCPRCATATRGACCPSKGPFTSRFGT